MRRDRAVNASVLVVGDPTPSGYVWPEGAVHAILQQANVLIRRRKLIGWTPPPWKRTTDEELERYTAWMNNPDNASHKIRACWMEDKTMKVSLCALGTPNGNALFDYLERGGLPRIGVRAWLEFEPGTTIIRPQNIQLVAFDIIGGSLSVS